MLVAALGHGVRRWRDEQDVQPRATDRAPRSRRRAGSTPAAPRRRRRHAGRRGPAYDGVAPPAVVDRGRRLRARSRARCWSTGAGSSGTIPIRRSSTRAYQRRQRAGRSVAADVAELRPHGRERIVEVDAAPLDFAVRLRRAERRVVPTSPSISRTASSSTLDGRVLAARRARATEHYLDLDHALRAGRAVAAERRRAATARGSRCSCDDASRGVGSTWSLLGAFAVGRPRAARAPREGSGELGGGALGVGIEVARGRSRSPIDARLAVAAATRPLRRRRRSRRVDRAASRTSATRAAPARSRPASCSAGSTTSSRTTRDGRVISDTHECVPFPDPNDHSTPPPAPALPDRADDRRRVARGRAAAAGRRRESGDPRE